MVNPKLSIIITCYNLGIYLEDALLSVHQFLQKKDYEIILVNDGSTDAKTIQIINSISQLYPEVIIHNQVNLGLAKARNNGIKLAKGKYIIPLDADNKLRPIFIEKAITFLNENKDIHVIHGNAQKFGLSTELWKSKPFDFKEMVLNNYIDACACFRKSTWKIVGGFDEEMPVMGFEDWDLWLRMGSRGFKFEYFNEVFFDYRVREQSMLSDAWKKRELLLKYIFNKNELIHLGYLRDCLIENQLFKQEPSINKIFKIMLNKIYRKFKL